MFHSPRVRHPDHSKKIRRLGVHNPSPVRLCTKPHQPACLQLFTDIKEITVFIGNPAQARVPARDGEITFRWAERSRMTSDGGKMKPSLGKSPLPSPASSLPAEGPLQTYKMQHSGLGFSPLLLLRPIKRLLYISSSSCQGQLLYDCWFPRQITPISELMLKVHIGSAGVPAKHSSMEPEVRLCPASPAELLLFFF